MSRFAVWLGAATAVGFLVRILNVLWWRPTTNTPGYHGYRLWGDALYYHYQANALAKGHWFVDPAHWLFYGRDIPSAGHPPVYTTYLALWSAIGLDGVTAHRLASSMLGTATIVVIGLFVRQARGQRRRHRGRGHHRGLPADVDQRRHGHVGDRRRSSPRRSRSTAVYLFWRVPRPATRCLIGRGVLASRR